MADQRIQVDAAGQASAAAAISPQWQILAKAMTEENGFPLTGNTPAQEAAGARDLALIEAQCRPLVAPSSSSTSSTSPTPVSGTEVSLRAGSPLTMAGGGCGPGALVSIVIEGTNHATDQLASVPADRSGRFSITVNVPYMGTPTADVSASCVGRTERDWAQIDTLVHYLPPAPAGS